MNARTIRLLLGVALVGAAAYLYERGESLRGQGAELPAGAGKVDRAAMATTFPVMLGMIASGVGLAWV